ncbi:phage tail protein I [Pseudomonas abyssi]|nr:phage tail protein I [Pseudomonas abyssi]
MSNLSLLPPNSTLQERSLEEVSARLDHLPLIIRDLWSADTCPDDLLPWLAKAVSVDVWSPAWTPDQKRGAIRNSLAVHRKKGTIGAVRDALRALGFESRIQEWFNQIPPGPEYTYQLILEADQIGFSLADAFQLLEVVENAKNLRSHLTKIKPIVRTLAGPVIATASAVGTELTLGSSMDQEVAILKGFAEAEELLNTITNVNLPQTMGA